MSLPAKISCRNLWKIYGADPARFLKKHGGAPSAEALKADGYIAAVRNVNFDVHTGEILVVMGLSGSGKSTLVRCLSRLVEPTNGEIFFDGRNLLTASDAELIEVRRHQMGMVFQHFALLPHRTVIDNIAFPLEVQGLERKKRFERARELTELVGLAGRENYYPRELSGGQRQRVGIARSLAVEPDIWFLDEPFSALDPLIRREMQNEFLRLQQLLKKSIVFISHDFEEAIRLADRIAIMFEGEIVQIGTPEELILHPATDYVRDFTRGVPVGKILKARSVMEQQVPAAQSGVTVPASSLLNDIAAKVIETNDPALVVDDHGKPIGQLSRRRLVDILFSRELSN